MLIFEIVVLLCFVLALLKFESVLLQLFLLVSYFPLITFTAFLNNLPLPGVLFLNADLFSIKVLIIAYIVLVVVNLTLLVVLYPLRNSTFEYRPLPTSPLFDIFLLLLLFISALISYPRVFGFDFGIDASTIYISLNVVLLLCKKKGRSIVTILHSFILLLVIMGGDRVDSLVAIAFLYIMNGNKVMKENYNKTVLYVGAIFMFCLSIASGILRDGNSVDVLVFFRSLYAQQTVSDVLYVFLCSVAYYVENGITLSVLGNLLFGLFPGDFYGVVSPYNFTIFLKENFALNPGGGLFFSEGILAFGPFGAIIYMLIYALVIKFLFLKMNKPFYATLFILNIVMLCRIQWYGFIYSYKPIIFTILLLFFLGILQYNKSGNKDSLKL